MVAKKVADEKGPGNCAWAFLTYKTYSLALSAWVDVGLVTFLLHVAKQAD
jgi:hypothetical protein